MTEPSLDTSTLPHHLPATGTFKAQVLPPSVLMYTPAVASATAISEPVPLMDKLVGMPTKERSITEPQEEPVFVEMYTCRATELQGVGGLQVSIIVEVAARTVEHVDEHATS